MAYKFIGITDPKTLTMCSSTTDPHTITARNSPQPNELPLKWVRVDANTMGAAGWRVRKRPIPLSTTGFDYHVTRGGIKFGLFSSFDEAKTAVEEARKSC